MSTLEDELADAGYAGYGGTGSPEELEEWMEELAAMKGEGDPDELDLGDYEDAHELPPETQPILSTAIEDTLALNDDRSYEAGMRAYDKWKTLYDALKTKVPDATEHNVVQINLGVMEERLLGTKEHPVQYDYENPHKDPRIVEHSAEEIMQQIQTWFFHAQNESPEVDQDPEPLPPAKPGELTKRQKTDQDMQKRMERAIKGEYRDLQRRIARWKDAIQNADQGLDYPRAEEAVQNLYAVKEEQAQFLQTTGYKPEKGLSVEETRDRDIHELHSQLRQYEEGYRQSKGFMGQKDLAEQEKLMSTVRAQIQKLTAEVEKPSFLRADHPLAREEAPPPQMPEPTEEGKKRAKRKESLDDALFSSPESVQTSLARQHQLELDGVNNRRARAARRDANEQIAQLRDALEYEMDNDKRKEILEKIEAAKKIVEAHPPGPKHGPGKKIQFKDSALPKRGDESDSEPDSEAEPEVIPPFQAEPTSDEEKHIVAIQDQIAPGVQNYKKGGNAKWNAFKAAKASAHCWTCKDAYGDQPQWAASEVRGFPHPLAYYNRPWEDWGYRPWQKHFQMDAHKKGILKWVRKDTGKKEAKRPVLSIGDTESSVSSGQQFLRDIDRSWWSKPGPRHHLEAWERGSSAFESVPSDARGTPDDPNYATRYKIPESEHTFEQDDWGGTDLDYRPGDGPPLPDVPDPYTTGSVRSSVPSGFSSGFSSYRGFSAASSGFSYGSMDTDEALGWDDWRHRHQPRHIRALIDANLHQRYFAYNRFSGNIDPVPVVQGYVRAGVHPRGHRVYEEVYKLKPHPNQGYMQDKRIQRLEAKQPLGSIKGTSAGLGEYITLKILPKSIYIHIKKGVQQTALKKLAKRVLEHRGDTPTRLIVRRTRKGRFANSSWINATELAKMQENALYERLLKLTGQRKKSVTIIVKQNRVGGAIHDLWNSTHSLL